MNNRLETIVDLKKYPIQDLNSPLIKDLIKKCKNDLDQFSCATIPNFILHFFIKSFINGEFKFCVSLSWNITNLSMGRPFGLSCL